MKEEIKLSLHIKHPSRDLLRVCKALGLPPTHIWKKGDERRTPKGNKIGGIREYSYCSIHLEESSRKTLAKQLLSALTSLKPHQTMLRELLSTGGTISFYVGWFCNENTGDILDRRVLEEMVALGVVLELNIYLPD